MQLHDPWLLALLLLLPLVLWMVRRERPATLRYPLLDVVRAVGPGARTKWRWLSPALRAAAFVLLVLALARPQLGKASSQVATEGIDILLAVDISGSMLAEDFTVAGQRANRERVAGKIGRARVLVEVEMIGVVVVPQPVQRPAAIARQLRKAHRIDTRKIEQRAASIRQKTWRQDIVRHKAVERFKVARPDEKRMIRRRGTGDVRPESKRCRGSHTRDGQRLSTKELLPIGRCEELDELDRTVRAGIDLVNFPKVKGCKETANDKEECAGKNTRLFHTQEVGWSYS